MIQELIVLKGEYMMLLNGQNEDTKIRELKDNVEAYKR